MDNYRFYIKTISQPAHDLLVIELVRPNGAPIFDYQPGQYVMLAFRNAKGRMEEKHAFSLASSPTEVGILKLGIRVMGRFTRNLAQLKQGSEIMVYGPFGSFSFNEKKHFDAVFLAGGIGITPFLSALQYATDRQLPNRMSLIYSNRTLAGTAFFSELQELSKRNPNMRALFSVTDETVSPRFKNVVNERISLYTIKDFIGSVNGKVFFLCGPAPFMAAMKEHLLNLGATDDQVMTEEFAMISTQPFWAKIRYAAAIVGYSALALLLPFYIIYAAANKSLLPLGSRQAIISDGNQPIANDPTSAVAGLADQARLPAADLRPAGLAADNNLASSAPRTNQLVVPRQRPVSRPAAAAAAPAPAPKPTTASSIPANEKTKSSAANTNKATANNVAPRPATSASQAQTTNNQAQILPNTNTAPAPSTSVSGAPVTNSGTANPANSGTAVQGGRYDDD